MVLDIRDVEAINFVIGMSIAENHLLALHRGCEIFDL